MDFRKQVGSENGAQIQTKKTVEKKTAPPFFLRLSGCAQGTHPRDGVGRGQSGARPAPGAEARAHARFFSLRAVLFAAVKGCIFCVRVLLISAGVPLVCCIFLRLLFFVVARNAPFNPAKGIR